MPLFNYFLEGSKFTQFSLIRACPYIRVNTVISQTYLSLLLRSRRSYPHPGPVSSEPSLTSCLTQKTAYGFLLPPPPHRESHQDEQEPPRHLDRQELSPVLLDRQIRLDLKIQKSKNLKMRNDFNIGIDTQTIYGNFSHPTSELKFRSRYEFRSRCCTDK